MTAFENWKQTLLWIGAVYLALINLAAFVMYGIDKRRAVKKKWRIPEARLILMAVIGGAAGAMAGMKVFHHKTKHLKFTLLVPLFFVLWTAGLGYLAWKML